MACNPQLIELIEEPSSYAVNLSITISSELSRILWIEKIRNTSELIWEDEKQFYDDNNWQNMRISFKKKRTRDSFVRNHYQ